MWCSNKEWKNAIKVWNYEQKTKKNSYQNLQPKMGQQYTKLLFKRTDCKKQINNTKFMTLGLPTNASASAFKWKLRYASLALLISKKTKEGRWQSQTCRAHQLTRKWKKEDGSSKIWCQIHVQKKREPTKFDSKWENFTSSYSLAPIIKIPYHSCVWHQSFMSWLGFESHFIKVS